MYACISVIGYGFFEGVCTPSDATAHSCDPPPPGNAREPEPHWQGSGPRSYPTKLLLMGRAPGCCCTAGAISLSDTPIIQYCVVFIY
jgi:hypothetical protein